MFITKTEQSKWGMITLYFQTSLILCGTYKHITRASVVRVLGPG